jgi:O-acetyl-ADP-ribose deacetylase (regulator of RNase III)
MITHTTGDILQDEAEAIINTVNCVGVMGRGLALQFKKAFPLNFKAYAIACKQDKVQPGRMFVYHNKGLSSPRYIINFPTKRHWRDKSLMEDVEAGLEDLVRVIREKDIKSIALPALGCGLGGLDWSEVKAHIEQALAPLADIEINVYEPKGAPASEKMVRNREVPMP